jgi:hypothetical protein
MKIIAALIIIVSSIASAECKIVGNTVRCTLTEYQALTAAAADVARCAAHTETLITQANQQINQCNQVIQQTHAQFNQCTLQLAAASQQRSSGGGLGAAAVGVGLMGISPFMPRGWRKATALAGAGTAGLGLLHEATK